MDKKMKKKWVKALRSKEYKQGQLSLRTKDAKGDLFCCLGVLCDLYDKKGWEDNYETIYYGTIYYGTIYYGIPDSLGRKNIALRKNNYPPKKLVKKLGLKWDDVEDLAGMNDHGHSFKKIADHIEENL